MNRYLRVVFAVLFTGVVVSNLAAKPASKNKKNVKTKKIKVVEMVENEGAFQAKNSDVTAGSLRYFMKASVGGYQIYSVDRSGGQTPLLSGLEEFTTTFYDLKIGRKIYRLSDSICAVIGTRKNELGGQMVYVVPNKARVFLKFERVKHDESVKSEIVKVTITVLNRGKKTESFALKSVIDTVLGEKTGPHFVSSSEKAINSERQVRKMDDMKWLISSDGKTSMQLMFKGADIVEPEVVSLSNKDFLTLPNWVPNITKERNFDSVLSYNNSAVGINWDSKILAPGEQSVMTYYMIVATDGDAPEGEAYIKWHEKKYGKSSGEKYMGEDFEKKYAEALVRYEAGEYEAAYEIVMGLWEKAENQNDDLKKLKELIEAELNKKQDADQKSDEDDKDESEDFTFYDYEEDLPPGEKIEEEPEESKVPPKVNFDVNSIDSAKFNPEYVQGLIDRINSLEKVDENIDRTEILKLHAELDAIIEKLRRN